MEHRYDRRTFVRASVAGTAALTVLGGPAAVATASRPRLASAAEFDLGVASGLPTERGITLWTRAGGLERPARLGLEVALDPGFGRVVHRAHVPVRPEDDFTVRARVAGRPLRPGEQYFYRFFTRGGSSLVGRFRTARPADSREAVSVAFFSCQEYVAGYYNAHADLARQDVDLVVCLGDYVYERVFADTASVNAPVREDATAPDGEAQTLAEYRAKYRLYHSDPDLQAMRAAHALVCVWDDHEVEDGYAGGLPGGAARNRRVPFAQRRANGYRAFFENVPSLGRASNRRIYGRIRLGAAEVFLLDTRRFRDDQPCNPQDTAISPACPPEVADAPRTLLGSRQKAWLKRALAASKAPWKIVANQVMIASLDAPPRNPLNTDGWDGYGAERAELIDFLGSEGIQDVAFVTGDIHTFFAGNVTRTGRQAERGSSAPEPPDGPPRATEFVGGSITSPGVVDRRATTEAERVALAARADAFVLANNPQIAYSNQAYKGYGVLTAQADALTVRFRANRETRVRGAETFTLRTFSVARGVALVRDEGGPVPPPTLG